jgi:hypothetical protein
VWIVLDKAEEATVLFMKNPSILALKVYAGMPVALGLIMA